jgi:hypothetical protein
LTSLRNNPFNNFFGHIHSEETAYDELSDVLKLAFKHVRLAAEATVKEDLGIRMQEAPDRAVTNRDPSLHRLHDRKRHG